MSDLPPAGAVSTARAAFNSSLTRPLSWRRTQLKALRALVTDHADELKAALWADLHKSPAEAELTELSIVRGEIDKALLHLSRWVRPRPARLPLLFYPAKARLIPEPLGVVGIIAPWNYPVQLLLTPAVGAIAAGNTVILKPSESAPHTSDALSRLVSRLMDPAAIHIVTGGPEATTEILDQRLDHVFYTGGAHVARLIMRRAADTLTPVTLELGGKSPVWVDDGANVPAIARRIAWAKWVNAGQTCVAPDYVLTTPALVDPLAHHLREAVADLWGDDPATSPDYGRIINDSHVRRLGAIVASSDIMWGGRLDAEQRYIEPTLVRIPSAGAPFIDEGGAWAFPAPGATDPWAAMREEIFGPILPVLSVASVEEAISFVRAGDKPLAVYVFSASSAVRRRWREETSSGAFSEGVALIHAGAPELPFGGVGASGMGSYHGIASFETFSHLKPILTQRLRPDLLRLAQPDAREAQGLRSPSWLRRIIRAS